MNFPIDILINGCEEIGLSLSAAEQSKFIKYAEFLVEWNSKINLTAITEPREIAIKHFLDSLMIIKYHAIPENGYVIDIGTGAGFPGVVLKVMRPDIHLTLLDGLNKRIVFLKELCDELQIESEAIHGRAEEFGNKTDYREKYDLSTARAVSKLNVLSEYCLPFVKPGGSFIALKSADIDEEAKNAYTAIKTLGGEPADIKSFNLSDGSGRSLVTIKKISQTPIKYPRNSAKISKKPL